MKHGLMIGKFLPPHQGHVFLGRTADSYVPDLTILISEEPGDAIDGDLRQQWMQAIFPKARVRKVALPMPSGPDDSSDIWQQWARAIKDLDLPKVDVVMAGDRTGFGFAKALSAEPVIIDPDRDIMAVTSANLRRAPFENWAYIPGVVRPHYVKRVCLYGPESTGKTTLARELAARYDTVFMPEYGRSYDHEYKHGEPWTDEDLIAIAKGHEAMRKALERSANRIVIEDTDPVLTAVWAKMLLGHVPSWFDREIELADLYLLMDIDVPWIDDGMRVFGKEDERRKFMDLAREELEARGATYITLSGDWYTRKEHAIEAVDELLKAPR
ncbi:MAG: transcriptional regulator [Alphaproteobacteria bacterium]|nr:MAG: transcriptional regulator [Alphaproteobacteria bacterium]